jgi:hypothetical protein
VHVTNGTTPNASRAKHLEKHTIQSQDFRGKPSHEAVKSQTDRYTNIISRSFQVEYAIGSMKGIKTGIMSLSFLLLILSQLFLVVKSNIN